MKRELSGWGGAAKLHIINPNLRPFQTWGWTLGMKVSNKKTKKRGVFVSCAVPSVFVRSMNMFRSNCLCVVCYFTRFTRILT